MNMNCETFDRNHMFVMYVFNGTDKGFYFSCVLKGLDHNFRLNCEFVSPLKKAPYLEIGISDLLPHLAQLLFMEILKFLSFFAFKCLVH
jgi:hypothetical protein